MIPVQLKDWQCIRVHPHSKVPVGLNWWHEGNTFPTDYPPLLQWIASGGNYGVCGDDHHFILDVDDPRLAGYVAKTLPKTFTVRTGSGKGFHFYYTGHCRRNYNLTDPKIVALPILERRQLLRGLATRRKALLEAGKTEEAAKVKLPSWGQVQSQGRMVVGANCIHPSGGVYTVVDDRPIAHLGELPLVHALKPYIYAKPRIHCVGDLVGQRLVQSSRPSSAPSIAISITQVVPMTGLTDMGNGDYQGPHPIHGSNGGMNFRVSTANNTWYCFRCQSSGNAFHYIAMEEGILDCAECGPGVLRGDKFKIVLKIAQERGLIAQDPKPAPTDPVPAVKQSTLPYRPSDVQHSSVVQDLTKRMMKLFKIS